MSRAYYNEIDPFAAQWLRNLISADHIAPGDVDERSIEDVTPADLTGYTQCHFFAGIGIWSLALRKSGWSDDRPVWTGSCPCQPFSVAGKGEGTGDKRHLWPVWFRLIRECKPPAIYGEQVASLIVTGKYGGDDVQSMWETWQFLNLRKDRLEGKGSFHMQGLPEFGREPARKYQKQSEQTGGVSQEQSNTETNAIRLGCGMGDGTAGSWNLPIERATIRLDGTEGFCNTIVRQDQPEERLHEKQYTCNSVRVERSIGYMGGEAVIRSGDELDQDSIERINDLIAEISCELETDHRSSWLNTLQFDLGRNDYSVRVCVTPSAGVGAPHIRQRLWFNAQRMADASVNGWQGRLPGRADQERKTIDGSIGRSGATGRMVDAGSGQLPQPIGRPEARDGYAAVDAGFATACPTNGFWRNVDWLYCRDGKWRPVEPCTFPLAHGVAARVGRLRAYGNAINAEAAEIFIRACA